MSEVVAETFGFGRRMEGEADRRECGEAEDGGNGNAERDIAE